MGLKSKVLSLVEKKVDRNGVENLIKMMKKTDFFVAPASRNHHLNYEGGLLEHSWNVYQNYKDLVEKYNLDIPEQSIIIESLGHDFCKIGLYKKEMEMWTEGQESYLRQLVNNNSTLIATSDVDVEFDEDGELKPVSKKYASDLIGWLANNPEKENCPENDYGEEWSYNDTFPAGHGEKSVFFLQRFIRLEKREILAIRWHMGAFEDGVYGGYKSRDFNRAREMYPDVNLLHIADMEASFSEDWV